MSKQEGRLLPSLRGQFGLSINFKSCLTFNSVIPYLVVNPTGILTLVHKEIHTRKFTPSLFEQ